MAIGAVLHPTVISDCRSPNGSDCEIYRVSWSPPLGAAGQHSLHGAGADTEIAGNAQNAFALFPGCLDGVLGSGRDTRPTQRLALLARPGKSILHPRNDHGPFELAEHPHHLEHGVPGGGVGRLLVEVGVYSYFAFSTLNCPALPQFAMLARASRDHRICVRHTLFRRISLPSAVSDRFAKTRVNVLMQVYRCLGSRYDGSGFTR
jgi:hypothetical protein